MPADIVKQLDKTFGTSNQLDNAYVKMMAKHKAHEKPAATEPVETTDNLPEEDGENPDGPI